MTITGMAGIFPGQGSQTVGMGRDLVERFSLARDLFAEADAQSDIDLSSLCFSGPADELKRTSIAQPALVTVSTIYWRLLRERGFACAVAAGHSLGEYSALVAAEALSFADAIRLVRRRGQLMEEAAATSPGGMLAVIGMDDDAVIALCAEIAEKQGVVAPANFNAPGQLVVSGTRDAIAAMRAAVKEKGGKAVPLAVSGPFHSPLMQQAAAEFAGVLADVPIASPVMPIIPNVTAEPTTDPAVIRQALTDQITGSVQWVRTLSVMHDMEMNAFVEIGPGNVLSGLVQRILPDANVQSVNDLLAD